MTRRRYAWQRDPKKLRRRALKVVLWEFSAPTLRKMVLRANRSMKAVYRWFEAENAQQGCTS